MNRITQQAAVALCTLLTACSLTEEPNHDAWKATSNDEVTVAYQLADAEIAPTLLRYASTATATVETVLGLMIGPPLVVYIYPDRVSMEAAWAARFGTPPGGFQCWMIANADVTTLVMLSPRAFATD